MENYQRIEITPAYLNYLMQHKNAIAFIKENYEEFILRNISTLYLASTLTKLYSNKELQDFMDEKFCITLQKLPVTKTETIIGIYTYNKSPEETKIFLTEKLCELLAKEDNIRFLYCLKFKNISQEIRESLNNKIKRYKDEYVRLFILKIQKNYHLDYDMIYILESLFQEILDYEQKDWIDIDYIDSGGYSHVYKIGSKILKVGKERASYEIPHDKRILQPLIRVDLASLSNTNRGTIEVCEKVEREINISEEELYNLYKELRERGIVWSDIKKKNVGRLLKDNKRYWDKNIANSKRAVGYKEEGEFDLESDILKRGDLVILDTDFIYYEDDHNIKWPNKLGLKFERRYQQEKSIVKKRLK